MKAGFAIVAVNYFIILRLAAAKTNFAVGLNFFLYALPVAVKFQDFEGFVFEPLFQQFPLLHHEQFIETVFAFAEDIIFLERNLFANSFELFFQSANQLLVVKEIALDCVLQVFFPFRPVKSFKLVFRKGMAVL